MTSIRSWIIVICTSTTFIPFLGSTYQQPSDNINNISYVNGRFYFKVTSVDHFLFLIKDTRKPVKL